MANQTPRQLTLDNLYLNVWRKNNEVVPPNGTKVLCVYTGNGDMWFDTYNNGWQSPIAPDVFHWQKPALPLD